MAAMKPLWIILAASIYCAGCANPSKTEPLPLSASYLTNTFALKLSLRQEDGRDRLSVAFQNISNAAQPIDYLTNLFEGKIILRDQAGQTHEFLDREFLWLAIHALLNRSNWFIQPSQSIQWELRAEDLVDFHRRRPAEPGQQPRGPTLSSIGIGKCEECVDLQSTFEAGCAITAALRVNQWRMTDRKKRRFSGAIYSEEITK